MGQGGRGLFRYSLSVFFTAILVLNGPYGHTATYDSVNNRYNWTDNLNVSTGGSAEGEKNVLKAAYITEIIQVINEIRTRCGLSAYSWTGISATNVTVGSRIEAAHMTALKTAVKQIYTDKAVPLTGVPISYEPGATNTQNSVWRTDRALPGSKIISQDINDLRLALDYISNCGAATPTCSDTLQNQGETGIDCGGPCAAVCPVCGNGTIETGEICDDSNTANGDGCSATCQTEPALCYGKDVGFGVSPACDTVLTRRATLEACEALVGSPTCDILTEPSCAPYYSEADCGAVGSSGVCGNGTIETGETCDDSNTTNGDGCSSTCQSETCTPDGVLCATSGEGYGSFSACEFCCSGPNVITIAGSGAGSSWNCGAPGTCGNGVREGSEACDLGVRDMWGGPGNGACPLTCSSSCTVNLCSATRTWRCNRVGGCVWDIPYPFGAIITRPASEDLSGANWVEIID